MRLPRRSTRPRPPHTAYRELRRYRSGLLEVTGTIDALLRAAAQTVDGLRIRTIEADEGLVRLASAGADLERAAAALAARPAPQELHALHREYEAGLDRARRAIILAERACRMTDEAYRPAVDEEVFGIWRRAHANIRHAALRMGEVVQAAVHWEPGRPAEVSVATRLERT